MSAPTATILARTQGAQRRLKLRPAPRHMPERLALARSHDLTHIGSSNSSSATRSSVVDAGLGRKAGPGRQAGSER